MPCFARKKNVFVPQKFGVGSFCSWLKFASWGYLGITGSTMLSPRHRTEVWRRSPQLRWGPRSWHGSENQQTQKCNSQIIGPIGWNKCVEWWFFKHGLEFADHITSSTCVQPVFKMCLTKRKRMGWVRWVLQVNEIQKRKLESSHGANMRNFYWSRCQKTTREFWTMMPRMHNVQLRNTNGKFSFQCYVWFLRARFETKNTFTDVLV